MISATSRGAASVRLAEIVDRIGETYRDGFGVNHLDGVNLPRRAEIVEITEKLLEVIFPGFDGRRQGHKEMIAHDVAELLKEIYSELFDQMCRAIRYSRKVRSCEECGTNEAVFALLDALPQIRETVKLDVEAAYAGDPAATSYDEIILSYPGIKAITIQRMAHVLYHQGVPFIPRMMTEHAHSQTGIDIHPGRTSRARGLHRPRHRRGDRRDGRDRRQRADLPGSDARRREFPEGRLRHADQGQQAPSDHRQQRDDLFRRVGARRHHDRRQLRDRRQRLADRKPAARNQDHVAPARKQTEIRKRQGVAAR